ncbi:MAG: hypothetical protein PHU85_10790, partial [Phycisphaerae bacterium]|nr:hypothetical protein [Phycisphaerae bacterium]
MPKSWRTRLAIAISLICMIGAGLVLRLSAEPDDAAPPTVSAGPAKSVLPDDYPTDDVEMFGRALSAWDEDSARVIQYRGDFRMDFARRRIGANDAVVWITAEKVDGKQLKKFVIYLDGAVRISEVGGTTVTAGRQIVTFQTVGRIWTDSNVKGEPAGDSAFYKRAVSFRDRAATTQPLIEPEPPASQPVETLPKVTATPITYKAGRTSMMVRGEDRLFIADEHVYISRANPAGPDKGKLFMEIEADRGVVFARESKVQQATTRATSMPEMPELATGAYLEGAVVLRQGERTIEASRLYYDFEHERALILDAILFEPHPGRNVPMIVWAEQIRQLSGSNLGRTKDDTILKESEFVARNARITTSEMNTPQYDLRAKTVYLKSTEKGDGKNELYYKAVNEAFEVRGVPILPWFGSQGTFDEQETALKTLRMGTASHMGVFIDAA